MSDSSASSAMRVGMGRGSCTLVRSNPAGPSCRSIRVERGGGWMGSSICLCLVPSIYVSLGGGWPLLPSQGSCPVELAVPGCSSCPCSRFPAAFVFPSGWGVHGDVYRKFWLHVPWGQGSVGGLCLSGSLPRSQLGSVSSGWSPFDRHTHLMLASLPVFQVLPCCGGGGCRISPAASLFFFFCHTLALLFAWEKTNQIVVMVQEPPSLAFLLG